MEAFIAMAGLGQVRGPDYLGTDVIAKFKVPHGALFPCSFSSDVDRL